MECTLASLLACFSLSGLYVDTGISWQDQGNQRLLQYGTYDPDLFDAIPMSIPYVWYEKELNNPYADARIGYEIEFRRVTVSLEFAHRSSISTGYDKGFNYARLGFRAYPFRRQ